MSNKPEVDSVSLAKDNLLWRQLVLEQMDLFAKNPSNSNKYFTNLLALFDNKLAAERRKVKGEVKHELYKLDWIKILQQAIEMRRTSWGDDVVREWRNASDEVCVAVVRALFNLTTEEQADE